MMRRILGDDYVNSQRWLKKDKNLLKQGEIACVGIGNNLKNTYLQDLLRPSFCGMDHS